MEENNNLVESFENSLLSDDKKDLIATVGDTSIDAIVSNGALDGIPIFGILNSIYKVGKKCSNTTPMQESCEISL